MLCCVWIQFRALLNWEPVAECLAMQKHMIDFLNLLSFFKIL